jgi:uncharacterized protein YxeA
MKKKIILIIIVLIVITLAGGVYYKINNQENSKNLSKENDSQNRNEEISTNNEPKVDSYGYRALSELPQDYSLEQAIDDGCVVITYNKIYGKDKLDKFIENTKINSQERKEDKIRIVQFTVEGDLIIKDLEYKKEERLDGCLEMDKTGYILTVDNTRDKFSADEDRKIAVDDDIPAVFYGIIKEEKDDDIHIVLALYAEIDYASDAAKIYKEIEVCTYPKRLENMNSNTTQN